MSNLKVWIKASRPFTLPAAVSPILVGVGATVQDGVFDWLKAILCFLIALLAQIAANISNDYFDFVKGADGVDRLGPERVTASGDLSPEKVRNGAIVTLGMVAALGLWLVAISEWWLLLVGLGIIVGVWSYTAGPFPLAYHGLGEVAVILFFGFVPVCFTYYVMGGMVPPYVYCLGGALGIASTNILMVNNYRDYESDKVSKKHTTVVRFGLGFARFCYPFNFLLAGVVPFFLADKLPAHWWIGFVLIYLYWIFIWMKFRKLTGRPLNGVLAKTGFGILLYAIWFTLGLLYA